MKKFKFKLQTVLDFRTEQVDHAQQALSQEEQRRQEFLRRIQECDALIETAFSDQQILLNQNLVDVKQASYFPQFLLRLKQERFESFHKLRVQDEIVAIKRSELKEAVVKKKALDLLKDKAKKAFDTSIIKAEEELLAEISLNKIARRIQLEQRQSKNGKSASFSF